MSLFKNKEIVMYVKQPFNTSIYETMHSDHRTTRLSLVGSKVTITDYNKKKDTVDRLYIDGIMFESVNIFNISLSELLSKCSVDKPQQDKSNQITVQAKKDFYIESVSERGNLPMILCSIKCGDKLEITPVCDGRSKNRYIIIINGKSVDIFNPSGGLDSILSNCKVDALEILSKASLCK